MYVKLNKYHKGESVVPSIIGPSKEILVCSFDQNDMDMETTFKDGDMSFRLCLLN